MKKKSVINLIKYHVNGDDQDFRNEAYEIANEFQKDGDDELARYVMALLSNANTFTPQSFNGNSEFFRKILCQSHEFSSCIKVKSFVNQFTLVIQIDSKFNF